MTLVELLVVIVLVSTLIATAIPVISPGGEGRKLREASRNVNAYLQGAQARATQTGRPFGVAIQRLSAETGRGEQNAVGVRMQYVEVPPAYSGFSPTSAVRIAASPYYNPSGTPTADNGPVNTPGNDSDDVGPFWVQFVSRGTTVAGLPQGWAGDLTPPQFLQPGDTVEVNGRRYELLDRDLQNNEANDPTARAVNGYFPSSTTIPTGVLTLLARPVGVADGTLVASLPLLNVAYYNTGLELPGPEALANEAIAAAPGFSPDQQYWTEPKPYKIYRQPAPAGGEPMELPAGVAIDLQASVVGGLPVTQLYNPASDFRTGTPSFEVVKEPVMILFAPEGHVHRLHGVGATFGGSPVDPQPVASYIALCIGRTELIPAAPQEPPTPATYNDPVDTTTIDNLSPAELSEITDLYNWLNLESRWVVIAGQTGSVSTVENVTAPPAATTAEQLYSALENARSRTKIGGR